MSNQLTYNFSPIDSKQWKQQIQFELNGLDYNDTLVWESLEGIKVKPFYTKDDLPLKQSNIAIDAAFNILQDVYVHDSSKANSAAQTKILKGANSIWFILPHAVDLDELFIELPADKTFFVRLNFIDENFIEKLINFSKNRSIKICFDPIFQLAIDGNWFVNKTNDIETLNKLVKNNQVLFVDGTLYQNSGANGVQQLAYILAHLTDYLNAVKPSEIIIKYAVGSHYFFEIAKLRALRILVETLCEAFEVACDIQIIAQPTLRNKTIYDYNVNMLRTTTEYMSAILGQANYIMPLPYDSIYHKSNPFGDRISRNQLLILKHESYFDEVLNAADGAYYIESLTESFSQKALELLKTIEKGGGFIDALFKETIQKHVVESADKEQQLFNEGKIVLLGTNKYPNAQDQMKNNLELYPFVKSKPRKTIVKPLVAKRLAESIEKERLEKE